LTTITKIIFLGLLICGLLIIPAIATDNYLGGRPDLSAYISGTNEFSPGDEIQLPIIIENTGINSVKIYYARSADISDQPSTAKLLTATLQSGSAPLVIKTDPQMLGDLASQDTVQAVFIIRINTDAPAGTYSVPLTLNYSYLPDASQQAYGGGDAIKYTYALEKVTLNIPITVKSDVSIDVISAEPEHLTAGAEGYIDMQVKNTGSENGKNSQVILKRNGNSPIIPMDSYVYIGDFPSGATVPCRYKVRVSEDAEKQTYPVDVIVEYQNNDGILVSSLSDTTGVPVGGKVDFQIISPPAEMNPGGKLVITVEYKNIGDTPVYSAQARISAVDPFTIVNDDVAYIGTLNPNESTKVSYALSVDRAATVKQYGLDSEIRYRDALDNTYISDPLKVTVNVVSPTGVAVILTNPVYLSIVAAAIIAIVYLLYYLFRKKQQ
jgi:hypothetical protein